MQMKSAHTEESLKNDLVIEAIRPGNGAKFSPNLFRWLTAPHKSHRAWMSRVYAAGDGALWIGYPDDVSGFIGQKLIAVLCNGVQAESGWWTDLGVLIEIADFWARYMRSGRCAIDTTHSMYFIGDDSRWAVNGDTRQCQWCGHGKQVMRRWTEAVQRAEWVNQAKGN